MLAFRYENYLYDSVRLKIFLFVVFVLTCVVFLTNLNVSLKWTPHILLFKPTFLPKRIRLERVEMVKIPVELAS